jgi:hypothetical protein
MSKKMPPQSMYFEYMKRSHQLFVDRVDEAESYKLIDELGIKTDVIKKCVDETFKGPNHSIDENSMLRESTKDWEGLGAKLYPQLVINGMTFKGRLTPDNAFEAICASF